MACTDFRGVGLGKTNLHGTRMSFEAFGSGQGGDGGGQLSQGAGIELLNGDHFDVVGGGQAAAQSRYTVGRQDVIGAGSVVARGFGAEGTDEDAARMADFRYEIFVVNGQMFRRETVGEVHSLIE